MLNIWKNTDNDFYKLDPVNEMEINNAELELGVKLPNTYKKQITIQNGGFIIYNAHPSPVPTVWGENLVKFDAIMGIGKHGGILESEYFIKEWGMPVGLIMLNGDGHLWIALDYRETKDNPSVIFIDNESGQMIELAKNYDDFINSLYHEEESRFEVEADIVYTKEELIKELGTDDYSKLIDLINMMSYSYEQGFVLEQYLNLARRQDPVVSASVAAQLSSMMEYDKIVEQERLRNIIKELLSSNDDEIRMHGRFLEEDYKNLK